MALRYEVKADVGEYKDAQGVMKRKYIKIGVVIDGKNGGFTLKLESIPVGWNGWAFLSQPEARPNRGAPPRAAPSPAAADDIDDDIPF